MTTLLDGARALGLELDESQAGKLIAHLDLLDEWGQRMNLTAIRERGQQIPKHVLDSLTVLPWLRGTRIADIGSGAGFPGLIVAALHRGPVTLVEDRRLRIDFLRRAAPVLGVEVEIVGTRVERLSPRPFDVISARAFAPLPRLLDLGTRFSTRNSVWILPKGRNAQSELEAIRPSWQGEFRLEPSVTDDDARIIVAQQVERLKDK